MKRKSHGTTNHEIIPNGHLALGICQPPSNQNAIHSQPSEFFSDPKTHITPPIVTISAHWNPHPPPTTDTRTMQLGHDGPHDGALLVVVREDVVGILRPLADPQHLPDPVPGAAWMGKSGREAINAQLHDSLKSFLINQRIGVRRGKGERNVHVLSPCGTYIVSVNGERRNYRIVALRYCFVKRPFLCFWNWILQRVAYIYDVMYLINTCTFKADNPGCFWSFDFFTAGDHTTVCNTIKTWVTPQ